MGATNANEISDWILGWLQQVAGVAAKPDSALAGAVDSLLLAELLVASEERWQVAVEDGFALRVLSTVGALAKHISDVSAGSRRQWYWRSPGSPGSISSPPVLPSGAVAGRTTGGRDVVGLPTAVEWSGALGSVLLVGDRAQHTVDFVDTLHRSMSALGANPVWLPLLTNSDIGAEHPQNVGSGASSGRLPHAACLQLLAGLPDLADGLYAGLGYAFRREPRRNWDPAGRLEAFRVYEIVCVGSPTSCHDLADACRGVAARHLRTLTQGNWRRASDGFTPGITRKLEWEAEAPSDLPAIASFNEHGCAFTGSRTRESWCIGIGVDRLAALGLLR